MAAEFKKLFEPGYLGKVKIKNRLVQSPMSTFYAARDGSVSQRQLDYYREKAMGGIGLTILEYAYVDQIGSQGMYCQLGIYNDSLIPGLSTLARVIKDNGSKAFAQLVHCGRMRHIGPPVVAPSRVPLPFGDNVPEELTIEEIQEIVKAFGRAGRRAEQAGYDGVEILASGGYLITGFLSPHTNRRGDMYGGNLQNRMRFCMEIVAAVKKNVSRDFPVGVKITGSEYIKDGVTIEESQVLAGEFEKAGIDYIHVTGGTRATITPSVPMIQPLAFHVPLAEKIKKVVKMPVIAVGSITSPQLAEEILEKGQADFIALARPLLADPWFAKKAKEGRPEDIAPCIRCNVGCYQRGYDIDRAASCTVNATIGFEGQYDMRPAAKAKKVAVVGGGPGGMEAARVAALRGHNVTLYEKRDRLGGYLIEASVPDFKKDLVSLTNYLSTQVKKLGIKVVLGKEATVRTLQQQGFDSVILATGSTPLIPDIPGIDRKSVMTAIDVLRGKQVGKNVVVAGGGLVGCEVALFLAQAGKKVRIIEMRDDAPSEIEPRTRKAIFDDFAKYGVQFNEGLRLEEVTDGRAVSSVANCTDRYGRRTNFDADSVVLALGFVSNADLLAALEKTNMAAYPIGDCVKPRLIWDAIHEGFFTSYLL